MEDKEKFYIIMPVKVKSYVNIGQSWVKDAEDVELTFSDPNEAQLIANQVNKFLLKVIKNYKQEKENEQLSKEETSDSQPL